MISLYDVLEASNGQLFGEPAAQLFSDFCFDSRLAQESQLYVALKTDRGDGHQYMQEAVDNGVSGILCSNPPSFDTDNLSVILVKDPQTALLAWARYALKKLAPHVIAVSGSMGKSVTAEVITRILSSHYTVYHRSTNYDGRLHLPLALAKLTGQHQAVVLELDSTQPGEMAAMLDVINPVVSVITNIGYAHIDHFQSQEQIAQEHMALINRLEQDHLAVLNYDDDLVRGMASQTKARVLTVGAERFGADLMAYNIVAGPGGTGFDLRDGQNRYVGRWTPLLGKHQLYSILNGLAVGLHYGIALEEGLKIVKELAALPGRMNPLQGVNGSILIDDSYNADPQTMIASLEWLQSVAGENYRTFFIMGDMDHLGAFTQRGHRMVGQQAAAMTNILLTEGADAALAGRAALDEGMDNRRVHITYSTSDVITRLKQDYDLNPHDIILVKGGASARMEAVVQELLADSSATERLPRQDIALSFSQPLRSSWVEVDLNALATNVRGLKNLVGSNVTLVAVVKADAYGAGAVAVARTALFNGAEYLATASIAEALELRDAGIEAPILVMSYTPPTAIRQAVRHNITITLYDLELARAYDRVAREAGGKVKVHVKVDTGMGRLGVLPDQTMALFRHLFTLQALTVEGIYTHFSSADEDPDFTAEQVRVFKNTLKPLRASGFDFKYTHAANSAGTLASRENHFNMVRVGLAMHGLSPSETVTVPPDFQPVLSWKTSIAQVKTLPAGHAVGYGNTYHTRGEETVAVIPVGYADGFRRAPYNWGHVLIHGQTAPIIGRVSMEKTVINVSQMPDVSIGDEVVLLGRQGDERITADEIARRLGTISYEIICGVLPRVPRR